MSKTKSPNDKISESAAADIYAGSDVLKSGLEKTTKVFETAADLSKGSLVALVESAMAAGEGFRTISSEISLYTKKALEESAAATKAVMGSKSIHEAFEHQSNYAKMAFGAYIGQAKLLNELLTSSMKDTFAPVQSRFEAYSETLQNATAA